jgi:RND family efflux transporter MFP subunit
MLKSVFKFIKNHKITSLILLLAIGAGVYFGYTQLLTKTSEEVSYTTATVKKGDILSLVSSSGQVGDANQINLMSEVSGEITEIAVKEGQEVKSGDLIAQIDDETLENEIYQASLAVQTAQNSLDKLIEPASDADILKAENAVTSAENSLTKLKLTQDQEMETAKDDRDEAQDNLDDLSKDDLEYDTKKETYKSQIQDAKQKIETYKITHPMDLAETEAKVTEAKQALEDVKAGTNEDEIEAQELNVAEKQSQLNDLISQRSDYTVTAPKDGTVAIINYEEGEKITGGGSVTSTTALAVLISQTKNAVVSINEVDVPSVSVGLKANLTFDALPDLEMTGTVSEVDLIGTVENNVVYNNVTVAFDTQDERIKNGMTVNVDIITQSKKDILIIASSAIKTQGDSNYVQILNNKQVETVKVEIGISDDTNTEILSGLSAGDEVILKTNTSSDSDDEEDDEEEEASGSILNMGSGGTQGGPPSGMMQ